MPINRPARMATITFWRQPETGLDVKHEAEREFEIPSSTMCLRYQDRSILNSTMLSSVGLADKDTIEVGGLMNKNNNFVISFAQHVVAIRLTRRLSLECLNSKLKNVFSSPLIGLLNDVFNQSFTFGQKWLICQNLTHFTAIFERP